MAFRVQGAGIDLKKHMVLFCGADYGFVVNGEAAVIRVADDLDRRILHNAEIGSCVLCCGPAVIAGFMDAGNCIVQAGKIARLKVDIAFVVDDVQLTAKHQLYSELFPGNDPEIDEIKRMAGAIFLDGELLEKNPKNATGIGYMFQKDHLFEWRDIFSNVSLGLEIQKKLNTETKQELSDLLSDYGLAGFEHAKPSALSGGMRQRAALIRTLALKPDLLLLDEPFSALDHQTRLMVCDDISSILRKNGKTAILVTHDLSEAISFADRIIVLTPRPGRIRTVLYLSFPDDCNSPLKRRNCPEFSHYFNTLWKELIKDDQTAGI